jgi:hypothetical protein
VANVQLPEFLSVSARSLTTADYIRPRDIRAMRRDPTIRIARMMVRAPIVSTLWSVEKDTKELQYIADFVAAEVLPLRFKFLETVTRGVIDHGWQPYEKFFQYKSGYYHIDLKPLLQEITEILIDEDTGEFLGFKNGDSAKEVEIGPARAVLINIEMEGDNYYGESYLASAKQAYDNAVKISRAAEIYDRKVAGAHWIITYPDGESMYNGVKTRNQEIATDLIRVLENSGSFAIPKGVNDIIEGLNTSMAYASQWTIDLKEASGSGANFGERLARCDVEKVRAFGLPERAILEGQFGTKAEADSHGDFAITAIEWLHTTIIAQFNEQVVDSIVRINFGQEYVGKVYVRQEPLNDESRSFLRELYKLLLATPEGSLNEVSTLDIAAIRDRLGVPYTEETNG